MTTLLAAALLMGNPGSDPWKELSILFLGNSHTTMNNLYAQVVRFLEHDNSDRKVRSGLISGAHLKNMWIDPSTKDTIQNGNWDYVVMQGQEISMSHKYDYSKQEAINLALLAKKSGAKALFFAEWPRRNVDESDYIFEIYAAMAAQSGAEVVPVGYGFEKAIGEKYGNSLWSQDGNHCSQHGAYLGALTIYYWIAGTSSNPTLHLPREVDRESAETLESIAKNVVDVCRKNPKKIPTAAQWRSR